MNFVSEMTSTSLRIKGLFITSSRIIGFKRVEFFTSHEDQFISQDFKIFIRFEVDFYLFIILYQSIHLNNYIEMRSYQNIANC